MRQNLKARGRAAPARAVPRGTGQGHAGQPRMQVPHVRGPWIGLTPVFQTVGPHPRFALRPSDPLLDATSSRFVSQSQLRTGTESGVRCVTLLRTPGGSQYLIRPSRLRAALGHLSAAYCSHVIRGLRVGNNLRHLSIMFYFLYCFFYGRHEIGYYERSY